MRRHHPVTGLVVAGLSGGSGKSVAAVGLVAALRRRGRQVIPFKKGPDYIDAGWLAAAAATPCYNLDPFLMPGEVLERSFLLHAARGEMAIIEGNRGLYDGVNSEGGYSTAELAKQLALPVVLVVNCSKTTRTVAALVLGCQHLDREVDIRGVILNHIATPRHEAIVRQSVERYTGLPVLGIVPRMRQDVFPMRHLGVTPHQEFGGADDTVAELAAMATNHFDMDRISALMAPVGGQAVPGPGKEQDSTVTIGVLRDMAFQFYYQENLEALERGGARLVFIDALQAASLPSDLDALYIGGGFPETSARQLAENSSFRDSVRTMADLGLPIYAECGGLIFLGQAIRLQGHEYPLAGVFPVVFGLGRKPVAHGYSIFQVERENPFYPPGARIKGHEFRYSTVESWGGDPEGLVLRMERGTGFTAGRDGLQKKNVLALYTHVLAPATPQWAAGMLAAARRYRQDRAVGPDR